MSTKTEVSKRPLIYVYVLVDEQHFERNGRNVIKSALYVGKGTGARMDTHLREAEAALRDNDKRMRASNPRKLEALIAKLNEGKQIRAFRISAGYSSDRDAHLAETLAITLINSSRPAKDALLNAVQGHHAVQVADMATHFLFAGSKPKRLPKKPRAQAVLVKLREDASGDAAYEESKKPFLLNGEPVAGVHVMRKLRSKADRREFDPMRPLQEAEAQERARKFWPIEPTTVAQWLSGAMPRPEFLFAAVPDGGHSVVRYIWTIDWSKGIELYPASTHDQKARWGLQLHKDRSPALEACIEAYEGKVLMDERIGRAEPVQALYGYASGVRVIGI